MGKRSLHLQFHLYPHEWFWCFCLSTKKGVWFLDLGKPLPHEWLWGFFPSPKEFGWWFLELGPFVVCWA